MRQETEEHIKECSEVSTKKDNETEQKSPIGSHNR